MKEQGSVILVGAGPGDRGLLTLRGKEAIESAQVVLYDRLVGSEILAMIPKDAEAIDVGKRCGQHLIPQERINDLILEHVRMGKRVVRLKGGDPYLFGRGGEELQAAAEEGFPFEVTPGITSAIAVPAYAGIPVSHRDFASSVHIITGHPRNGGSGEIDFASLARLGGTLVFLMGVGAIGEIRDGLLAAGMDPATPAALVENGTRPEQRKLVSTLEEILFQAEKAAFHPPSVLVIGKVCALSEQLDWVAKRPLHGMRVLVTRPEASAGELSGRLRALGCAVTEFPCIRTEPIPVPEGVFESLSRNRWIVLTSPMGASLFFQRMEERGMDARVLAGIRLAAVGPKTAEVLRDHGILADLIPEPHSGKQLAAELVKQCSAGDRALLFRASRGGAELPRTLADHGILVEDVAAYNTLYETPEPDAVEEQLRQGEIDCAAFTSASTVEGFRRALPTAEMENILCVCIGEETAAAAREAGMRPVVSEEATLDSLVQRLVGEVLRKQSHREALK